MIRIFSFILILCSFIFKGECFAKDSLWISGSLPAGSSTEGRWFWDEHIRDAENPSHTDDITDGLNKHSFVSKDPVSVNSQTYIIQYVLLDKKDPPEGIMMRFALADDKKDDIAVYWEGEDEVFKGEYTASWYMSFLPEKGVWAALKIYCGELDIEKEWISGISFITAGGRAWWGRTVIVNDQG